MKERLEQLKADLVIEIKAFAQEIANTDSFYGLIAKETRFNALQEKFMVLRYLEENRLKSDFYNLPIPTLQEKQEILESEGFYEDEQPVIFDFEEIKKEKPQKEEKEIEEEEEEEEATQETLTENKQEELFPEETLTQPETEFTETFEEMPEEELFNEEPDFSLIENLKTPQEEQEENPKEVPPATNKDCEVTQEPTVETHSQTQAPPLLMDFNDRIGFLNVLFLNDENLMNLVLQTLNNLHTLEESQDYIEGLEKEMDWEESAEEFITRLKELNANRFN